MALSSLWTETATKCTRSASVLMCNVAALPCMQLFMKNCVVAVILKKGMCVPGTAVDVCIVLTLMYYVQY